ncbi:MAG: hypothetical protein K5640_07060 [Treponema sp.]|nr:hypothetical protein [Treponema sp.]
MSKRTFNFVVGITGGIAAIASATVVFLAPPAAPAIVASISIAETAITEICSQFVK